MTLLTKGLILEFSELMRILRRSWTLVLTSAAVGILIAGGASLLMRPVYTAETQLFVAIQSSGSVQDLQQGNTFTQARVQSYVQTVDTPAVLQPAIDNLALDVTPAELGRRVKAAADLNTVIISISAVDESPVQAAAIAQAVTDSLVDTVEELERPSNGGSSPVKLSIVMPASASATPSDPNVRLNLLVGAVLGLASGLAAATLRFKLDTKVRGEEDLRRITDKAVLGGITFDSDATRKPLLTQTAPQSPRAESFRQIRTNLQFAQVNKVAKAILVTSSLPGEGKSTTATNLAIAMAQSGQSVVLVDADLRRPRIDEYLGLERNAGLTTVLIGRGDLEDLLQPWGSDELYILTAGQIPPNPSELLGSEAMKQLITRLEQKFDAVIIDAPPLLPVTDAAVLAQQVGGVVLVVGASKVRRPDLEKSLGSLEMVNADMLGIVVNLLPSKGPDAYAYSYYSYETATTPKEVGGRKVAEKLANTSSSDFDERIFGLRSQER